MTKPISFWPLPITASPAAPTCAISPQQTYAPCRIEAHWAWRPFQNSLGINFATVRIFDDSS